MGALHALLFLRVIPSSRSAEDVLAFLADEGFALEIALREQVLVGAGEAFEAVNGAGWGGGGGGGGGGS
jgi:hypothetical protein